MYVIVTNYGNWHRENLRLDRENTGNLKIQFEWVPYVQYLRLDGGGCTIGLHIIVEYIYSESQKKTSRTVDSGN